MDDKLKASLANTMGSFITPRAKDVTQGRELIYHTPTNRLHPEYVGVRLGEVPKSQSSRDF